MNTRLLITIFLIWLGGFNTNLKSQKLLQEDIKVYAFEQGLSHRNVFKITEDDEGFIWIATISGLNRFDGTDFRQYGRFSSNYRLAFDAISDLYVIDSDSLLIANRDYICLLTPFNGKTKLFPIKEGQQQRRQSKVPNHLWVDASRKYWYSVYDEKTGESTIECIDSKSHKRSVLYKLSGQNTRRPIMGTSNYIYIGAQSNELWQLDTEGSLVQKFIIPDTLSSYEERIVHFQAVENDLWILLSNGHLLKFSEKDSKFSTHIINDYLDEEIEAFSFLIDDEEDVWIGARGQLLYWEKGSSQLIDYAPEVREQTQNTCLYRQILQDHSGVVWVATDFGAISISRAPKLFDHYLAGGSEYCSNVFCSMRGITEDEQGHIFFSYYNSIHQLNPETNSLKPLFGSGAFFNYPFGLHYQNGCLWTGNGLKIQLNNLHVDTLFSKPTKDLGVVISKDKNSIWIAYQHWLYDYDIINDDLKLQNFWSEEHGQISFLYQDFKKENLWIATLDNGLWKYNLDQHSLQHYHPGNSALRAEQINAILETQEGDIWLGTAMGVAHLNVANDSIRTYTMEDGLPNDFINGILSEGDSCLWVSTDMGLARMNLQDKTCVNFYQNDGLSANEFNRNSFYKSRQGRMYFGGMNGVNAFYPSVQYKIGKQTRKNLPLHITSVQILDGRSDSLRNVVVSEEHPVKLRHRDRYLELKYALANYNTLNPNYYSCWMENLDSGWSEASLSAKMRYNSLPPGKYIFHLRARAGRNAWNKAEINIPVLVQKAWYDMWSTRLIGLSLFLGLIYGTIRYRFYMAQKRQHALEQQVERRTEELQVEKKKSEDLLLNILPAGLAEELKKYGQAQAKKHEIVTVMFSDFVGFTKMSATMDPEKLVALIDYYFSAFDRIIEPYNIEKIKTIGDAYLCVSGIETHDSIEALNITKAAIEIQHFLKETERERKKHNLPYFRARIGIHTGPVVAGVVGVKKFAYDIWGDTVNIAARMETNSLPGEINVSETTNNYIRDQFITEYHGIYEELDAPVKMYLVKARK